MYNVVPVLYANTYQEFVDQSERRNHAHARRLKNERFFLRLSSETPTRLLRGHNPVAVTTPPEPERPARSPPAEGGGGGSTRRKLRTPVRLTPGRSMMEVPRPVPWFPR